MRRIAVLLHQHTRLFDYGVIHEVFGVDRTDSGLPAFEVWRCGSRAGRSIAIEGGGVLRCTHNLAALATADLVLVPGGSLLPGGANAAERAALRAAHAAGVPIASLCSGAFLLADAGLLDGRRATTHWRCTEQLAARHPAVTVVNGPLWIEDGTQRSNDSGQTGIPGSSAGAAQRSPRSNDPGGTGIPGSSAGAAQRSPRSNDSGQTGTVWTSAGTAAGIDLCLHLVRLAHGAGVAAAIARRLVTPPHRDGGQAQYTERAVAPLPDTLTGILAWARANLDRPLSVAGLARRAHLSERTFARRFTETTGTTPLRWLHHQRVQYAQELLERTDLGIDEVARRTGFGTAPALRRHFSRSVGTTPTAYRQRFAA